MFLSTRLCVSGLCGHPSGPTVFRQGGDDLEDTASLYTTVTELGKGSYGSVHKAKRGDVFVAVKTFLLSRDAFEAAFGNQGAPGTDVNEFCLGGNGDGRRPNLFYVRMYGHTDGESQGPRKTNNRRCTWPIAAYCIRTLCRCGMHSGAPPAPSGRSASCTS